jgi:hypothetical protein
MTTDMNALDQILDFNPVGSGGSSNDYVGDGYWWLALTEISMPFQEPDFNDKTLMVTKVRFYFEVAGTYDRKTGDVVASEFDGQKVSLKVKADANGPKSTKYLIASALLSQDLAAYTAANGPVKPSQLIGLCAWGKVENKPSKKDPATSYTELAWDGFTAQLPPHLIRPVPGQAVGNRPAPQRPGAQPAAATGKSPF